MDFNRKHGKNIIHDTVAKSTEKFMKTASVTGQPRTGSPLTSRTTNMVLGAFARNPQRSTQRLIAESSVSILSFMHILKNHKCKMQLLQHLSEDDPHRLMEFCEWVVNKLDGDANFPSGIFFTDEANFYVNEEADRQNLHYWSDSNPHWMSPSKMQGARKLMVWCGIWGNKIVFFDTNLNVEMYLNMLQDMIMPLLLNEGGEFLAYFQQDRAPSHYGICVWRWLDQKLPDTWIGCTSPMEWAPRSPELSTLDFYL
jgi:hypothetical protein